MTDPRLPVFASPDRTGVDALVTDRYLDALLAAAERCAVGAPADAGLDPDLRRAGDVLRRTLVRVHPSFRFEERLAAQLAALPRASAGVVIAFRPAGLAAAADTLAVDPLLAAVQDGLLDPADAAAVERAEGLHQVSRPLIVGGAITSAAISIVGVALVAWRASRPDARTRAHSVMARAARTAHARRDAALAATGAGGPA